VARRYESTIWAGLVAAQRAIGAQELHRRLKDEGHSVGLTTVYRVLNDLARDGALETMSVNGETWYCACQEGHHHHLVCVLCGNSVDLDTDDVERWVADVSTRTGFTAVSHTLELRGICSSCPAP
jgi:Fur family ferric uptake transcriptional regulator